MKDVLVYSPFNGVFFAVFAIFIALLVASSLILKNKSRKTRRIVLAAAMIFTFVAFWVYKYDLCVDEEYHVILAAAGGNPFSWWTELPLQLCNINMIIIPLACILDNKFLYSFGFLVAPLGALMAIIMPSKGFYDVGILMPHMLGFYFTHFMILIGGLAIACFGLYKPKFKDIPKTMLTMFCVTTVVVGINFLLVLTGIEPNANYFFAMNPDGISLLEVFWSWIPVRGLYLISAGVCILLPYTALMSGGFWLGDKIKEKIKAKKDSGEPQEVTE